MNNNNGNAMNKKVHQTINTFSVENKPRKDDRRAYQDTSLTENDRSPSTTTITNTNTNTIGKTRLVNKTLVNNFGFKCEACSVAFTSYDAFLDHLNSRLHQKSLGTTGAIERVDDPIRIRARIQWLKEKKIDKEENRQRFDKDPAKILEERILQKKLEEEQKRKEKYQRKKEKDQSKDTSSIAKTDQEDDEEGKLMASVLGISSFK